MRLLFLDQFSTLGGAQQCLRDSVLVMRERGATVHAALPGDGPLIGGLEALGATVHHIPLAPQNDARKSAADIVRFAARLPALAFAIRRLVDRNRIDLVYVNGPRLLPAAALAGRLFVFHAHSLVSPPLGRALAGYSLSWHGTLVIASSRFVARPLARFVSPARMRVVLNGVADCGFVPGPRRQVSRIGIVGRVAPEKGHLDFLAAVRLLHAGLPGCRFVICGDGQHSGGSFAETVRNAARNLPVDFIPWQSGVSAVLRSLDLLVVPSLDIDATPRVIPEALSTGLPVIAYRSGGIPEMLEGFDGALLAPPNPEALASVIRDLVTNPNRLEELRHSARRLYEDRFTLARYGREIASALEAEIACRDRLRNGPGSGCGESANEVSGSERGEPGDSEHHAISIQGHRKSRQRRGQSLSAEYNQKVEG
jgi:glycosyltransferase involved in cell wall biosynthesis